MSDAIVIIPTYNELENIEGLSTKKNDNIEQRVLCYIQHNNENKIVPLFRTMRGIMEKQQRDTRTLNKNQQKQQSNEINNNIEIGTKNIKNERTPKKVLKKIGKGFGNIWGGSGSVLG